MQGNFEKSEGKKKKIAWAVEGEIPLVTLQLLAGVEAESTLAIILNAACLRSVLHSLVKNLMAY